MSTGYIRKSMLESFEFCPRQFYHQYIEGVQKDANQKMLIGTRFHEFAERFFDYAMVLDPQDWNELIPINHLNDEEIEMYRWFLSFQRSRLTKLQKEDRENEFVPMYRELFMICDQIQIKSTLDGAEWVSKREQTVRLIEYKTGGKMNTESAIRQLAFYAVLWELCGNPGTVTELQLINPRLQAIFTAELTPELKKQALIRVAKLRAAIDKNDYPYKCTDGKFAACKMCTLDELTKLFPNDGFEHFTDIYKVIQ